MQKSVLTLAAVALISLAGCQSMPASSKQAESKPAITPEASAALAQAETDVKNAKAKDALWTTADADLKKAKDAAAKGDSAATIKSAKAASNFAALGIAQLSYPTTEMK